MSAWLIDKSAITRLHAASDSNEWAARIDRGLVRIASVTLLEIGYSARSAADHAEVLDEPPIASMPIAYQTPKIEERAIEVQRLLAERGHHRAPSVPDVIIAATAELAELTVLHVDKDFELIAALTGQPVERLLAE